MNTVNSSMNPSAAGNAAQAATAATTPSTRVWDLPTRVFHWSLAVSFAGAWLTAESERWRDIHVMLGYTLAGLIAFRLVWGLVGSRYARFKSFLFRPALVVEYLKSLLSTSPRHYVGHNPAGALAVFALLTLGIVVAASGYATYQEIGGEWLAELHEGASNAMLALVGLHIVGVLVSSLLHRENLVRAMVTGWKAGRTEDGVRSFHTAIGALLLAAVLGFWFFAQSPDGRDFMAGPAEVGQGSGNASGDHDNSNASDKHQRRGRDDD